MRYYRYMVLVLVVIVGLSVAPDVGAVQPIRLVINDQIVTSDVPPVIQDGRTLVPVRVINESLGATVGWDPGPRRVTVQFPGTTVILHIDSDRASVNGVDVTLDVPAVLINGRTMVPLRFVAESLGAGVAWDPGTRTVSVNSLRVTDVWYERAEGMGRIVIAVPANVKYSVSAVDDGSQTMPRVILDLHGTRLALDEPVIPIGDGNVVQVRTGMVSSSVSRLVVDLTEPVKYQVTPSSDGRHLYLEIGYKVMRAMYQRRPEGQAVIIRTTGPVEFEASTLKGPDRIVVDLLNTRAGRDMVSSLDIVGSTAYRVRLSQYEVEPDIVRAVIDLRRPTGFHVVPLDNGVEIYLFSEVTGLAVTETAQAINIDVRTSMPTGHGFTLLSDPLRLCIDVPYATLGPNVKGRDVNIGPVEKIELSSFVCEEGKDMVRVEVYLSEYLGHEIKATDRGIQASITRSAITGKTVVIDPGHGGSDPGAISANGVYEKDVNLAISLKVRDILIAMGANVVMIRDTDTSVDLFSRPQMANLLKADAFVSIHANAFHDRSKHGFEVYHWDNHPQSGVLARTLHRHMLGLGLFDRGVKQERFVVLREAVVPAALVEVAFLSNLQEEKLLVDPVFQNKVARLLAEAIVEFISD